MACMRLTLLEQGAQRCCEGAHNLHRKPTNKRHYEAHHLSFHSYLASAGSHLCDSFCSSGCVSCLEALAHAAAPPQETLRPLQATSRKLQVSVLRMLAMRLMQRSSDTILLSLAPQRGTLVPTRSGRGPPGMTGSITSFPTST